MVPNLPCGVESTSDRGVSTTIKSGFLIYRVELKDFRCLLIVVY